MTDDTHTVFHRAALGLLAVAALLLPVADAIAGSGTLAGKVYYRERMALPPGAVAEVKLIEAGTGQIIAATRIPAGQGSAPYRLTFDRAKLQPNRSYALQARISAGGRLLFAGARSIADGHPDNMDILVRRVRGQALLPQFSPAGSWLAEDIFGGGVIDRLQSVLEIDADGAVSGMAGCNRISGNASVDGAAISFGPMAAGGRLPAPRGLSPPPRPTSAEVRAYPRRA